MAQKKKTFDAVKMVREIRNEHHEKLKDKSWQDRVAFYREQAQVFHERMEAKRKGEKA